MPVTRRTVVTLAALLALPVTAAHADGPQVVAYGQRQGDVCWYPDGVVLTSPTSAAIAVRAEDDCRLVVVPQPKDPGVTSVMTYRAKTESASTTAGMTDVVSTVDHDVLSASAPVMVTSEVELIQSIYDEVGLKMYEDSQQWEYQQNSKTGSMTRPVSVGGYCAINAFAMDTPADLVPQPYDEIRTCNNKVTYPGPDKVGGLSWGYYRKRVGNVVYDERELQEWFTATRTTFTRGCSYGPALKVGWVAVCDVFRH